MESKIQNYYTVIAIDEDWDRCFTKFIGIFSNYEFAKSATITHHNDFGHKAICGNKYEYKIFMGNLDEGVEIDTEDDLLDEENKEKIDIQKIKDDENRKKMEMMKEAKIKNVTEAKIKNVTEIFNEISCNKDARELTYVEIDHIIDFFDKYTFLSTNDYTICNRKFVKESLKNFEVIFKLKIEGSQINDKLSNIIDVYRKHGIKISN
jgi:rRNA maturation endonuclease Nob1